ncbi:DUF3558 domain-containing protein [Streptomyces boncukensis]|uniref:DUF3558 domain-containing protein n=1 Tax=Streptomyces boncukensis TaxID=2711219 RepID=A0A6G4X8H8_9ACTN|nr:DUF3558 domain-containing protein [Streptomyces boncukensis]NGO73688.1 DUF3558 domain-containing protein [Streptomyces boncukensis]
MHRNAPRTVRLLACAAVALPVLLAAGCSSDSGDGGKDSDSTSPSASKGAPTKAAPARFKKLPDSCKSVAKGTIKDLVPKTDNASGKRVGSGDTNDSNSCLWSGLDKYDYRQLTVSLKRFDSDTSLGSGDKRAQQYLDQQAGETLSDKDNKKTKQDSVDDVGEQATGISYEVRKKDSKGKAEDFTGERLVGRTANAVVTVDYEGAGFEDGKTPKLGDLKKKARKAANEVISHIS